MRSKKPSQFGSWNTERKSTLCVREKIAFGEREVEYLGHIIEAGRRVTWPRPRNVKELRGGVQVII